MIFDSQDGSTRPIQITVSDNVNVGDKIGEAIATDDDENPKIYYYIIGKNVTREIYKIN